MLASSAGEGRIGRVSEITVARAAQDDDAGPRVIDDRKTERVAVGIAGKQCPVQHNVRISPFALIERDR